MRSHYFDELLARSFSGHLFLRLNARQRSKTFISSNLLNIIDLNLKGALRRLFDPILWKAHWIDHLCVSTTTKKRTFYSNPQRSYIQKCDLPWSSRYCKKYGRWQYLGVRRSRAGIDRVGRGKSSLTGQGIGKTLSRLPNLSPNANCPGAATWQAQGRVFDWSLNTWLESKLPCSSGECGNSSYLCGLL